jgi:uncharacterized damage-inducible protein DinB
MPKVLEVLSKSEYAAYYEGYLEKVTYGDPVKMLIEDLEKQLKVLENIPEKDFSFRYKKNKWSLAELLLHICDTEAVFSYRALTFSRNDKSSLPGMEQDEWVENSNADSLSKKDIIGLFKTCRNHTIALYKSFNDEQLLRIGTASQALFSVRALAYIILGHNKHHFEIINKHYLTK